MADSKRLAKKCLWFLSENKRYISHFSPRTLLNNVFPLLFHYLLPFFRQLHNSIFPKLFVFLSKELFQVPFTVFQGIKIFSIKFCKDQNKWKYGGWIRTSQPSCNSFCLVINETCGLELSWWKVMHFLLTNSGCFSSSAAFIWSNWEQY